MKDAKEAVRLSAGSLSGRPDALAELDHEALKAHFDGLVSSLDAARVANDAQRCLVLALRTQEAELELRSRRLRETQEALRVSRDHYLRLFDEAPVGYLVLNRRGLIRSANLKAAELLGCRTSELEGSAFKQWLPEQEIPGLLAHLREVFSALPADDLKLHPMRPGPVRVLSLRSKRREGLFGPECLGVLLDITAEEEAEEQRQASDRLRQSVLDALPSQIAVLDRDGRILAANRAWRQFSGVHGACDALRAALDPIAREKPAKDGHHISEEVLAAVRGIRAVIQGERADFSIEYPCETAQGRRWQVMRALPLSDDHSGAVVTYFDITERHRAEEDARRTRDALAQVARLNAVGILASSLIHELLQPLSSAGFYCSAASQLAQGPAANPDRLVEVIRRIDDQVHRAGDIMERLRAFLRGREVRKILTSLDPVLRRAFELVLWFASDRKVRLSMNAPEHLPSVQMDPVQIEQVLVNLICNAVQAIDASDTTQRQVVLEVLSKPDEVEIVVRDTGPGLPRGKHEAVFDIFESTSDSNLGLGLAISRSIAEAHGGRLWAESAPAQGAVFHLTLPVMQVEDELE